MANFYADHFAAPSNATTAPPTIYANPPIVASPGLGATKTHRKTTLVDFSSVASGDIVDGDVIRLFSLQSGDRITEILFQSNAGFVDTGTLTVDIGLHAVNDDHTGAVLDVDLFVDGLTIDAAANEDVDAFLQSTTLAGIDRGIALWELLELGAGDNNTENPNERYDVTLTFNSQTAVTAGGKLAVQIAFTPQAVN